LSKTFSGEFFGNFNSARHEAHGIFPSFTTYSIALRKQIWKKREALLLLLITLSTNM
jgi:ferric enterobactin receptor